MFLVAKQVRHRTWPRAQVLLWGAISTNLVVVAIFPALVSLLLSPGEPYFQLSTGGKNGSCEVSYSKDSDVISSFAVSRHQIAHYALARLRPAIKGLGDATTASLKTNADGLLLIQMAIDVRTPHHGGSNATAKCWVDCFVVPLEDEEEMGGFGEGDDSDLI